MALLSLLISTVMSSSSAQQLANFTLLHYDKSTSVVEKGRPTKGELAAQRRHTPVAGACFLYLIAECSSLYVAKRALALFLLSYEEDNMISSYKLILTLIE
ncbi:hypothetical protein CFK40_17270 [Virgibacillus necropolis]|uniref:Secreted protein n=1 Tax=Virgibacillus necropolis TaxID=163877 RepID=A0A221MG59_9BACI|nr:hypothetical protein CFK40_17270 [Virgibacillus necropolis]